MICAKCSQQLHCGRRIKPKLKALLATFAAVGLCYGLGCLKACFANSRKAYGLGAEKVRVTFGLAVEWLNNEQLNGGQCLPISDFLFFPWNSASMVER